MPPVTKPGTVKTPVNDVNAQLAAWLNRARGAVKDVPVAGSIADLLALLAPSDSPEDLAANLTSPLGAVVGKPAAHWAAPAVNAIKGSIGDMLEPTVTAVKGSIGDLVKRIPNPIKAYHGSPHDFDQFSMSKIGTGEGAQAYGHGLYFAENEAVAKGYKEALAKGEALTIRLPGQKPIQMDGIDNIGLEAAKFLEVGAKDAGQFKHNRVYYALKAADRAAENLPGAAKLNEQVKARIKEWGEAKIAYEPIKGAVYEVNIHATPDELLDWDKPLSEQPQKVREALKKSGAMPGWYEEWASISKRQDEIAELPSARHSDPAVIAESEALDTRLQALRRQHGLQSQHLTMTGDKALDRLGYQTGMIGKDAQRRASEMLHEAGIKGIQYLDQGSRGNYSPATQGMVSQFGSREKALEGLKSRLSNNTDPERAGILRGMIDELKNPPTRNFVIFDDQLIEIAKKYGIPLAAAGAWVQSQGGTVQSR